jgi:hypothetical protein
MLNIYIEVYLKWGVLYLMKNHNASPKGDKQTREDEGHGI